MSKGIDRKFSEVISLFNSGKFIEAKEIAKKILRLDSNNSSIMEILCLINLKLENLIDAHKYISDAMKIKKDYLSHNYLGQVYYKMKNYDEAINNFNISIKLNNNVHVTYVNRGSVFEDLEEFEKAIEDYKKAIEINPKAYQAYNNIGNIYTKIGKFDESIKNLQIATLSNEFLPFYNLGCLFNRLNKNEEAIKSFNKSIELNPTHISSYRNRAYTNLRFKKFILAISDYKKIKEINEKNDDGLCNVLHRINERKCTE
jgi:tetratricopeptide (TPR) repeat protein